MDKSRSIHGIQKYVPCNDSSDESDDSLELKRLQTERQKILAQCNEEKTRENIFMDEKIVVPKLRRSIVTRALANAKQKRIVSSTPFMRTPSNFEDESFNLSPIKPLDGVENNQNGANIHFKPVQSNNNKSQNCVIEKQVCGMNSGDGRGHVNLIDSQPTETVLVSPHKYSHKATRKKSVGKEASINRKYKKVSLQKEIDNSYKKSDATSQSLKHNIGNNRNSSKDLKNESQPSASKQYKNFSHANSYEANFQNLSYLRESHTKVPSKIPAVYPRSGSKNTSKKQRSSSLINNSRTSSPAVYTKRPYVKEASRNIAFKDKCIGNFDDNPKTTKIAPARCVRLVRSNSAPERVNFNSPDRKEPTPPSKTCDEFAIINRNRRNPFRREPSHSDKHKKRRELDKIILNLSHNSRLNVTVDSINETLLQCSQPRNENCKFNDLTKTTGNSARFSNMRSTNAVSKEVQTTQCNLGISSRNEKSKFNDLTKITGNSTRLSNKKTTNAVSKEIQTTQCKLGISSRTEINEINDISKTKKTSSEVSNRRTTNTASKEIQTTQSSVQGYSRLQKLRLEEDSIKNPVPDCSKSSRPINNSLSEQEQNAENESGETINSRSEQEQNSENGQSADQLSGILENVDSMIDNSCRGRLFESLPNVPHNFTKFSNTDNTTLQDILENSPQALPWRMGDEFAKDIGPRKSSLSLKFLKSTYEIEQEKSLTNKSAPQIEQEKSVANKSARQIRKKKSYANKGAHQIEQENSLAKQHAENADEEESRTSDFAFDDSDGSCYIFPEKNRSAYNHVSQSPSVVSEANEKNSSHSEEHSSAFTTYSRNSSLGSTAEYDIENELINVNRAQDMDDANEVSHKNWNTDKDPVPECSKDLQYLKQAHTPLKFANLEEKRHTERFLKMGDGRISKENNAVEFEYLKSVSQEKKFKSSNKKTCISKVKNKQIQAPTSSIVNDSPEKNINRKISKSNSNSLSRPSCSKSILTPKQNKSLSGSNPLSDKKMRNSELTSRAEKENNNDVGDNQHSGETHHRFSESSTSLSNMSSDRLEKSPRIRKSTLNCDLKMKRLKKTDEANAIQTGTLHQTESMFRTPFENNDDLFVVPKPVEQTRRGGGRGRKSKLKTSSCVNNESFHSSSTEVCRRSSRDRRPCLNINPVGYITVTNKREYRVWEKENRLNSAISHDNSILSLSFSNFSIINDPINKRQRMKSNQLSAIQRRGLLSSNALSTVEEVVNKVVEVDIHPFPNGINVINEIKRTNRQLKIVITPGSNVNWGSREITNGTKIIGRNLELEMPKVSNDSSQNHSQNMEHVISTCLSNPVEDNSIPDICDKTSGTGVMMDHTLSHTARSSRRGRRRGNEYNKFAKKASIQTRSVSKSKCNPDTDIFLSSEKTEESEVINVLQNEELITVKYVEHDSKFTIKDNVYMTEFTPHVNGGKMGWVKIPPGGRKPFRVCQKPLFYSVTNGCGRVHLGKVTQQIGQMSRFAIPVGAEYSIINESEQDLLLFCVSTSPTKT